MQDALRGSVFGNYGCGCARKDVIANAIFNEMDRDDVEINFDPEDLIKKLIAMRSSTTASLIEQINRCYFAETMDEHERLNDTMDYDDDDFDSVLN